MASCAFANNPSDKLSSLNDEPSISVATETLSEALNIFFETCSDSSAMVESDEVSTDKATTFKENSLLGVSVGLEVLGRLLYKTLDLEGETRTFDISMVEQMAQDIDWSKNGDLWQGTVVLDSGKISAGRGSVNDAVMAAVKHLGW